MSAWRHEHRLRLRAAERLARTIVLSARLLPSSTPTCLSAALAAGQPSPNGVAAADAVTDVASHEITEAITDPFLNAWFDSSANEIGDLCAYNYGTNTWDGGLANEQWNGNFYEVQQQFDNHAGGCVQLGP
jgi:hypothetical protein